MILFDTLTVMGARDVCFVGLLSKVYVHGYNEYHCVFLRPIDLITPYCFELEYSRNF